MPEVDAVNFLNREEFIGCNFTMKRNRLFMLQFGKLKLTFPYKYDFADTFNERFITIVKWVRKYHDIQSKQDSVAFDLIVKIGAFSLEIEDDPFEVKLRNNYELLEVEYNENVKRQQALDVTINNYRSEPNIILTEKIIQKLKDDFDKKKHEIYIKRHKASYENASSYNIFDLKAEGIELKFAADKSLVGYEKLVRILKDIDPFSPFHEDMSFSTIWCRQMIGKVASMTCELRKFPQPMMQATSLSISGRLLGAEATASARARRSIFVDFGPELDSVLIERTMPPLKFYHDLRLSVDKMHLAHGAAWEPVLAQLSLCFENIIKPSRDPSPGLPWWDRMRLLLHGRLFIESNSLSLLFHASFDPYNKTEFMEIEFIKSNIEWLTGKIFIRGGIDLRIHTASKYDECRIIHLPYLESSIYLNWECIGNQYDHHSVMPCAQDKVPEYSSNQQHDSFRAFRSQNLNVKISIETGRVQDSSRSQDSSIPTILVYSNSIRWFENQKQLFTGLTRLTRRGKLFGNTRARKPQFSRIFKKVSIFVCLHKVKSYYWSSSSRTYGFEFIGENFSYSAEHVLTLRAVDDELNLHRRTRPVWTMAYMNSQVRNIEVWLYNNKPADSAQEENARKNRMYLLSISLVSYNRENKDYRVMEVEEEIPPTHRLVVHDLKGAWTIVNKEVVFALFDLYMRAQLLKRNLSTEALKGFKVEGSSLGQHGSSPFRVSHLESLSGSKTSLNKNYAASMLKKLIAESENNPNIEYSEDVESELIADEVKLRGVASCQDDDVVHKNWLIELINSQVVLRGCETSGYVIASAAKCQIWQKIHKPVWKERTLLSKETWVGSVDSMQYYATVDAKIDSDVVWLGVDNIQNQPPKHREDSASNNELNHLVGPTHQVGGLVSSTVNPADISLDGTEIFPTTGAPVQLQRIISRCCCQFYYVFYTEDIDFDIIKEIPPIPDDDDLLEPWDKEVAVDSFTLMHTELDVSTNSQQYAMIIDLVNNLLLYVEPHRKEAVEKMQHMRFQFQLTSLEEQREPISHLQDALRKLMSDLKQCEKDCYRFQRTLEESHLKESYELNQETERSERLKAEINDKSDDLAMRISCYKEAQVLADKDRERQELLASGRFVTSVVKRIEVCFKEASWVLTDSDGQLQLAKIKLTNFLYTKVAKNDDSVEHTLELGFISVKNRLPNQVDTTVLEPTDLGNHIPFDRRRALRIFCRERPPVAGIPVKEHFEVNVIPLTIEVTKQFFKRMLKFFFPDPAEEEKQNESRRMLRRRKNRNKDEASSSETASLSSVQTNSSASKQQDKLAFISHKNVSVSDVEKMRQRAQKNQTFVYIKIPEVPIKVSYKGGKSIQTLDNFNLILPTIEYHNQTWTWLDVLMAIKSESQKRLLTQAVKQKLTIWPSRSEKPVQRDDSNEKEFEEDTELKTRLLFGNLASPAAHSKTGRLTSLFKK